MNTPAVALKESYLEKKCEMETKEKKWMILTWIIKDYSKLENHVFYCRKATSSPQWMLRLIKSPPSLYVMLHPADGKPFVNFTVLGKNKKPLNDGVRAVVVPQQRVAEIDVHMLTENSGYLVDDCLTIQCKYLEKSMDRRMDTYDWDAFQQDVEVFNMSADLKSMYVDKLCSDFGIRVGFVLFGVHKAILATRCEFFAEMFSNTSPKKDDVEMTYTAEPAIFQEILAYIYADEFRVLSVDAMLGVLEIASDFKLVDLIPKCRDAISKSMSIDNVISVLTVAMRLNYKDLKNETMHFISNNCPSVLKTNVFKLALKGMMK